MPFTGKGRNPRLDIMEPLARDFFFGGVVSHDHPIPRRGVKERREAVIEFTRNEP